MKESAKVGLVEWLVAREGGEKAKGAREGEGSVGCVQRGGSWLAGLRVMEILLVEAS